MKNKKLLSKQSRLHQITMSSNTVSYANRVLIKIWALDAFDLACKVPGIAPSHPFDSVVDDSQANTGTCAEQSDESDESDDDVAERSYEVLPVVSVAIHTSALDAATTFLKSMGAEMRVFQLQRVEN